MTNGGTTPGARPTPAGLDGDVLERLNVGVWIVDRDGVSTFANRYLSDLLRVPAEEILGHPLIEFWHPADHATILDAVRRRREGQSDDYDARLRRRDGTSIHVRVQASPIGAPGDFGGAVAVITDLSDLMAAADDRDQALRIAETASLTKTRFLSWVSHELRTPLNTISGFAQLLEGSLEQASQREMAASILSACAHVNSLVQDLLDYSKADADMLEPSLAPVGVRDVCAAATALVSGAARELGVTLDTEVDDVYVMADHRHLVQVAVNLLSNAIKYGGAGSTVQVRSTLAPTSVRIAITDQGPGIPPELQQRAFRPFERLDNATTVDGVGLGLSIAESLVRAMRGSLTLSSPPGEGATFTIELPVTEPARRDDTGALEVPADLPRNQLVLYVEDEPLNASLVESIIGLLPGRSLHVEPTVAGGIDAAARLRPALVLLDLNLPDGSGFEVLSSIRADDGRCAGVHPQRRRHRAGDRPSTRARRRPVHHQTVQSQGVRGARRRRYVTIRSVSSRSRADADRTHTVRLFCGRLSAMSSLRRPVAIAAVAACAATMALAPSPVFAAASVSTSTNKCTITAKAPTLNAKKQLTGSVSVTCTAATVVTVDLTVVEMDGTTEDTKVLMVAKSFSTTVKANTAVTIATNTATCVSTETGNEEYATKGRVNLSGVASTWDRTVPATDAYAC